MCCSFEINATQGIPPPVPVLISFGQMRCRHGGMIQSRAGSGYFGAEME